MWREVRQEETMKVVENEGEDEKGDEGVQDGEPDFQAAMSVWRDLMKR